MRQTRVTEEQIIGIPKEAETGARVREFRRLHGITDTSFRRWRRKYGRMDVGDAPGQLSLESGLALGAEADRYSVVPPLIGGRGET